MQAIMLTTTPEMALQLHELEAALPDSTDEAISRSSNANVLLLGDGDFSFAAAYAELHPSYHLHVTEVLSQSEWATTYRNTKRRLSKLELDGNTVIFDVDARETDLVQNKDLVVFMFPFVARDREGTAVLVRTAMVNILKKADDGAFILLGLATQKKRSQCVAYQYGNVPAEQLVLECIVAALVPDDSEDLRCFALDSVHSQALFDRYEARGYAHSVTYNGSRHHALWTHNDKTAFLLVVRRKPTSVAQRFEVAHNAYKTLHTHCETHSDRADLRVPIHVLRPIRHQPELTRPSEGSDSD